MGFAFEVTSDDIATVLRSKWDRVANSRGMSFETMGETLMNDLDLDAVETAALECGTDMDDQTQVAHAEIESQLVEHGVLIIKKDLRNLPC